MGFYNTTKESGRKLKDFSQKAESQENEVLAIFKAKRTMLTASEVLRLYPRPGALITSIRRALSNLASSKKLEKTSVKRDGIYGRPETAYQLFPGQMTLFNH